MTTVHRVYNFSSGPAVLPLSVLEEVQRDLLALPGVGMSILEISHRSKTLEEMLLRVEHDIRTLADVPPHYKVLFLPGGASLQFSMVPANLLTPGSTADYIVSGAWSEKALSEAQQVGACHVAASTQAEGFTRVPSQQELTLTSSAAYVHMTSNNTIFGTQWKTLPDVGQTPLVSDTSSDLFSRPIDVGRHGLIYAGAQKNLGPAGVTLVIIRDDLVARSRESLPPMLSYAVQARHRSLYNTPPVFAIYVMGLVVRWMLGSGGLAAMSLTNERKAAKLYAEIDRTGFYRGTAQKDSRSLMNVTFRLATVDLEQRFVKAAAAAGFDGLQGHRSVGGIRASIYNAFPEEGIDAFALFMQEFERRQG